MVERACYQLHDQGTPFGAEELCEALVAIWLAATAPTGRG
jgi:hypothetical protein